MRRLLHLFWFFTVLVGSQEAAVWGQIPPGVTTSHRLPVPPYNAAVANPAQQAPSMQPVRLMQHAEAGPALMPEVLPPGQPPSLPKAGFTLGELEQMALSTNPSVARAAALVEAARGKWTQVGLPPNPAVGYQGQQIGSQGLAEQDGVFVEQEFVRGGKLKLNRSVASHEVRKAEQNLAAQQQRVVTDVRIAFSQVLIAQRQQALAAELHRIAAEAVKTADASLRGGEVSRIDLVQAHLELESVEILVQNAANRSRAAWQTLASVVGNPALPVQPLAGNLDEQRPPYEWQVTLQHLLTSSPEIAAAAAEIERARAAAQRALVEKTPNVTVQGLVNWRDNGIGGRSDGAITVGLPLPLWNRNQGGVVQAEQEANAAERALQQLELSLQNRLVPVYERYANALNQVGRYRARILPAAEESLRLITQKYKAGDTDYVRLLIAQRTYSQTNLNYLESLRELRAAEAEIDGLLLSGSLESR